MFRALSAYSLQTGLFRTPPETADGKPPPGPPVQPRIAPFDPSLLPPTSENTPPPWRLYTFCSFLAAISLLPPSQTGSVEGRNKAPYRGCFEKRPRRNIRPGNIGPSSTLTGKSARGKKEGRTGTKPAGTAKLIGLVEAADPFFTKSTTVVRRRSESRLLAC